MVSNINTERLVFTFTFKAETNTSGTKRKCSTKGIFFLKPINANNTEKENTCKDVIKLIKQIKTNNE